MNERAFELCPFLFDEWPDPPADPIWPTVTMLYLDLLDPGGDENLQRQYAHALRRLEEGT